MLKVMVTRLAPLYLTLASFGCAKPGIRTSPEGANQEVSRDLQLSTNPGSIAVSLDKSAEVDKISAFIVSDPILQKIDDPNISKLSLIFTDLPPESYDIIVRGKSNSTTRSLRINGIKVASDKTSRIKLDALPEVRSLSGKVVDVEGKGIEARVSIWGTDLQTNSNASGDYILEGVPLGKHSLLFSSEDFMDGIVTGLNVSESSPDQQGQMILAAASDDPSTFTAAVKDAKANTLRVPFFLIAPAYANQLRLSEKEDFRDAKWQAISSVVFFEFSKSGDRKLFAQFSKNGSSLSEILFTEVSITLP
jgi:hypothetical protein